MSEVRVRSKLSATALKERVGKVLTTDDVDMLLVGPTTVRKPDGSLLCKYLPGAFDSDFLATFYPVLHDLRKLQTNNRGLASGSERMPGRDSGSSWSYTQPIASGIIGSFDAAPPKNYCRLTAWSGREWEEYASLFPLFGAISDRFRENVPDRWTSQMQFVRKVHPDWVIPGTAFTTITVNNSYPTGVHTDKGDLDEGFSTLAVLRRGDYRGGWLTFPEYRVAVDMKHGDLLLMDAHEWHGNTFMTCNVCDEQISGVRFHDACETERISVVSYMRTKMTECGSAEEEARRAAEWAEMKISKHDQTLEEMAVEAAG